MNNKNKQTNVFITGANGGLATETIKWLIQDGYQDITMAARSQVKAEQAREEILADVDGDQVPVLTPIGGFDMTNPTSIEEAIEALPRDKQYDVIFLQAGGAVFTPDYQTVKVGGRTFERTIFQNVLGGHVTLALLRKYDLIAPGARVVAAGGEGARGLPPIIEKPHFASAQTLREYVTGDFSHAKAYNPMNAIGVSKFMLALWVQKMAAQEDNDFSTMWFSPGFTYGTKGLDTLPNPRRWIMKNIGFKVFALLGKAQSSRDGARKYANVLEGKIGKNGEVIGAPEGQGIGELMDQIPMNAALSNADLLDEFWAIANEVYAWQPSLSPVAIVD